MIVYDDSYLVPDKMPWVAGFINIIKHHDMALVSKYTLLK